ncbi:hypothetical protein EDEG_02640 [Edhazardia aedis USNM 41457]|uniref:Uncharacterized protein n=1 Tax=Edhazardia aedis (strain USNM 41457) TaxID=1003232 RepID=J9D5C3_EDHAE|nr:hypothetical protein EDEG_02640 [Edhazardia aedis USNM 41457]|eukprot:EJW02996.1 hypothetical protein EDEG_02640 [Edhazardia aedis USNM 41457]
MNQQDNINKYEHYKKSNETLESRQNDEKIYKENIEISDGNKRDEYRNKYVEETINPELENLKKQNTASNFLKNQAEYKLKETEKDEEYCSTSLISKIDKYEDGEKNFHSDEAEKDADSQIEIGLEDKMKKEIKTVRDMESFEVLHGVGNNIKLECENQSKPTLETNTEFVHKVNYTEIIDETLKKDHNMKDSKTNVEPISTGNFQNSNIKEDKSPMTHKEYHEALKKVCNKDKIKAFDDIENDKKNEEKIIKKLPEKEKRKSEFDEKNEQPIVKNQVKDFFEELLELNKPTLYESKSKNETENPCIRDQKLEENKLTNEDKQLDDLNLYLENEYKKLERDLWDKRKKEQEKARILESAKSNQSFLKKKVQKKTN